MHGAISPIPPAAARPSSGKAMRGSLTPALLYYNNNTHTFVGLRRPARAGAAVLG